MKPLFPEAHVVQIVVPDVPGRADLVDHLALEKAEMEVELGGRPTVAFESSEGVATLTLNVDTSVEVPGLDIDLNGRSATVSGSDLDSCVAGLSLLRTVRRTGDLAAELGPAATIEAAADRVADEVLATWPSLGHRDFDWLAMRPSISGATDQWEALRELSRWVARLGDAHTALHVDGGRPALPYSARLDDQGVVRLVDVPIGTSLWNAGVRSGDVVGADLQAITPYVGASPHMEPWVVGRRALAGPPGQSLVVTVRRADGSVIVVEELPGVSTWPEPVEHRVLRSGVGYLRVRRWVQSDRVLIDEALGDLRRCDRLVVDLRGNAGGQLVSAVAFRRRFVPEPTLVGSVRYSLGDGSLGPLSPYIDEPSQESSWLRPVRFLIDPLTFSASEDAILGLSQFGHVDVVGRPSGGGSGRVRTLPIFGDAVLTVSTALTFDHLGRCIEGRGVRVDRTLDTERADTVDRAASLS